jgi:cytochrome P450
MLGEDNLQIYPFLDAKNLRSLIRPGLDHSFIKNQFDTTILKVFEDHLLELKKRCEAQSDPSHSLSVRFQHELLVAGIRAGSLLIFGGDVEKENQIPEMEKFTNDFHTLVDSAVESGLAPLSSQRQQDFNDSKQAVEEALYKVIHIRREAMTRKEAGEEEGGKKKGNKKVDVLSLLLENEDPLTGKPFTNEKIVMLLKMSTNYTPAVASTWVLHLLAAHPEYMTRLVSDIDQVFSSKKYQDQQSLTYDDLDPKATPFLDAVVKETLRIYPTSPFAVRLVEDPKGHDLGKGYHLPPGTTLFVPIRDLQFNEKLWPDPEKFDPSRWLDEKRPPHPLRYSSTRVLPPSFSLFFPSRL